MQKTFQCSGCQSDILLKKGFDVSYKNIIISDFLRVRPMKAPVSKAATASMTVEVELEMDWVPEVKKKAPSKNFILPLQIIKNSEDQFSPPKWPTCLRDGSFMIKEVHSIRLTFIFFIVVNNRLSSAKIAAFKLWTGDFHIKKKMHNQKNTCF